MLPTLAALKSALLADDLSDWIAALPEAIRAPIRRALHLDRHIWTAHPDTQPSLLLLRTTIEPAAEPRPRYHRDPRITHPQWGPTTSPASPVRPRSPCR